MFLITADDFVDQTLGKKKKRENIDQFLVYMNALLNEGHGVLCIHVKDPFKIGKFDEAVDEKMLKLIPDNTFFHENFERHYHDENHVMFRVIPRKRPMSTHSFNTKVLTDTGFTEPTHGQIRHFLSLTKTARGQKRKAGDQEERPVSSERLTFTNGQAVFIEKTTEKGKKKTIPFQESMRAQAKGIKKEICSKRGQPLITHLISYCLDDLCAHNYMSAFSKLPTGGSLYIGMYEEKNEEEKWETMNVPKICDHLHTLGPDLKLFRDKKEKDLFHIATSTKVPVITQKKSGKFKPDGVRLTLSEQADFKQKLLSGLKGKMKMVPATVFHPPIPDAMAEAAEPEPIAVKFHKVHSSDTFVVEIRAEHFSGACFTDPAGPLAYRCISPENGPVETELYPIDVWFEENMKTVAPL